MNALIEAGKITKTFPGTLALDKVDFNLLPGEIHAIAGENGAGKSPLCISWPVYTSLMAANS
jgi:ABC-type sugar transport system ATPase subunit